MAVVTYEWDELRRITPAPGDILLGHPHPNPFTVFRRSMRHTGWARVVAMCPLAHGDLIWSAFLERVIPSVDAYLAITGSYWSRSLPDSAFAHWGPKVTQLDLAVDSRDFPKVVDGFNERGNRRFLYVGNTAIAKNTDYLGQIAALVPEIDISWMGRGRPIPHVNPLGWRDTSQRATLDLIKQFDFLITVGHADANPTTVLEAMSWGLVPVCTPQSGYDQEPGIVNVPVDSPKVAAAILRSLNTAESAYLETLSQFNLDRVRSYYTWERFMVKVRAELDSSVSPVMPEPSARTRSVIKIAEMRSPLYFARPTQLLKLLRSAARRGMTRRPALRKIASQIYLRR